jgi:hypothetical protein
LRRSILIEEGAELDVAGRDHAMADDFRGFGCAAFGEILVGNRTSTWMSIRSISGPEIFDM